MVPGEDFAQDSHFLYERYLQGQAFKPPGLFYKVKPLIPRGVQMAMRRALVRRAKLEFPAWPIEERLLKDWSGRVQRSLEASGDDRLPFVNHWPDGKRFAVVLTHDVEGVEGVERIPEVIEVERRHGFVSSWNFVAEWYPFDRSIFEVIRARGGEVGLHGIRHDGSLFRDRATFEEQLPAIRRYLEDWGALGFRSPSTIRNAEWMHELPCLYDSSFPQNDPYQPQPGGCCSPFPFFFGDVVELPITLDQDHTLFEFLREDSIEIWIKKTEWLVESHGLVNLIVHPDYMTGGRLELYERFLEYLGGLVGGWHALPAEVAQWWRARSAAGCTIRNGSPVMDGDLPGGTIAWARPENGRLVYET
jgi:hypothetical protein